MTYQDLGTIGWVILIVLSAGGTWFVVAILLHVLRNGKP